MAENVFDAIISLGVVEHRRAGPEPFLVEMNRILKPGGTLLISVPYFNPLRRWRAAHGAYQDDVGDLDFYQYAFTRTEFYRFLENAGFEIEKYYTYSQQNTLSQELHWLKKIPESLKKIILRISKYVPYVNSELGHMIMVVARKRQP
jgi:SAM-dependent methyltransferase